MPQAAPAALNQIDWLGWAPTNEHLPLNIKLQARIPDFKPVFTSDDFLVLIAACRAGLGALVLARAMISNDQTSDLVEVPLKADLGPPATLYLVAHERHRQLAKLQPVIAIVRDEFSDQRRNEPLAN